MEIKLSNVSYVFPRPYRKEVLSDINLTFKKGMINAITGPSGSGKTTLIQLINALIIPTSGEVKVGKKVIKANRKIININKLRSQIGMVFQFPEEQFFCKTVRKEIEFGLKYFKHKIDEEDVEEAMKMVGLDESYFDKNPFELSSGEMRKVAIATVLAFDPRVIILDEPTVGLDAPSKENLIKTIKKIKTKYKKTIIIVSHDTDMLLKVSDNVIVLNEGKVVLEGPNYEVFTHPDLEGYGIKRPKIIEFEQIALKKKKVRLGYRDEINDLMKDVYRHVK